MPMTRNALLTTAAIVALVGIIAVINVRRDGDAGESDPAVGHIDSSDVAGPGNVAAEDLKGGDVSTSNRSPIEGGASGLSPVTIEVLDQVGSPLEGVSIAAMVDGAEFARVESDENGRGSLDRPDHDADISMTFSVEWYSERTITVEPDVEHVRVSLDTVGGAIFGEIVDKDGVRVRGARLRESLMQREADSEYIHYTYLCPTARITLVSPVSLNANTGLFMFAPPEGAERGSVGLALGSKKVAASEWVFGQGDLVRLEFNPEDTRDSFADVTVRAIDKDGNPAHGPDYRVRAIPPKYFVSDGQYYPAELATSQDGMSWMGRLCPGPWTFGLWVGAEGPLCVSTAEIESGSSPTITLSMRRTQVTFMVRYEDPLRSNPWPRLSSPVGTESKVRLAYVTAGGEACRIPLGIVRITDEGPVMTAEVPHGQSGFVKWRGSVSKADPAGGVQEFVVAEDTQYRLKVGLFTPYEVQWIRYRLLTTDGLAPLSDYMVMHDRPSQEGWIDLSVKAPAGPYWLEMALEDGRPMIRHKLVLGSDKSPEVVIR